jgi:hypothetical protein
VGEVDENATGSVNFFALMRPLTLLTVLSLTTP